MSSSKRLAKKVLVIGWDAADWKAITPLLDSGKMPALERLVNEGVMGRIATLQPVLSPMLWTSMATGVRPFVHGVCGFTEPDPNSGGVRPVSTHSRKVKALWNILTQSGMKSNVIGWWPSHPAEPIDGVMVSNHYQRAHSPIDQPWPVAPGTVHPPELAEKIADLRVHPAELGAESILPFVPKAAEIDPEKDKRLESLARIVADCSSIHACATAVMQLEPWDFMGVYYDAIDHFGHAFMRYHPPRQDHIDEKDFEFYSGVIEAGYRFHDMMLGVLLKLAGEDTTVILVSDHGFHPGHLRPAAVPIEPTGPAYEHSPYGIIVMKGPGIKKDERIAGASVLDITPTVLTLFGLPVGQNMHGKPLVGAFEEPPEIESIPTWEDVPGEDGRHPPDQQEDPADTREAIRQLVALGYIDDPGENAEYAAEESLREEKYNLALSYIDANRHADAVPLLRELWDVWPDELRFGSRLAHGYLALERTADCRRVAEELKETRERLAVDASNKLAEYGDKVQEAREKRDAARKEAAAAAGAPEGEGEAKEDTDEDLLSEREKQEIRRLRALAARGPYEMHFLMGSLLLAENKAQEALDHLRKAEKMQRRLPTLHVQIGHGYLKLKKFEDAERAFSLALEIDPECAEACLGLCMSYLALHRTVEAAQSGVNAVALQYYYPQAHFHLGIALHRLGQVERAIQALEVALDQNPNYAQAHRRLAYIYEKRLKDPERAEHHRKLADELRDAHKARRAEQAETLEKELAMAQADVAMPEMDSQDVEPAPAGADVITIVSGLPRSGTSMLMQILEAGGIPPLTDGTREANEDNPRGYYELEKVKQLHKDASWLPEAKGKSVKIISQLLPFLPSDLTYRVVFIERAPEEVLASQRAMLQRENREGARLTDERLTRIYAAQVRKAKIALRSRKIATLYISYRDAIEQPGEVAGRLRKFLGDDLDEAAMATAVDRKLYRQKQAATER